ncbi:MAG: flagellar motor switch protein FliM [Pyrinomonadaceae bacterium]|nr:flagellar motor switch protein FliM [Pyrinomonadaceae bacterium]
MSNPDEKEKLLSDEEMSALLPENPAEGASGETDKRRPIVPYNFRRPDRLSKEQVRSLYLLHDLFAKVLSSSLPLFLRAITEVNLISVEQQSFGDYLRGMSDPTTIFKIAADQLPTSFAIETNSSIAFPIIDRMLGGEGVYNGEKNAATELEMKILEGFLRVVTENYSEVWRPIVDFKTELIGHETSPHLLQIVPPNEVVATIVYQMQIGESRGSMSICLPIGMLEGVIEKFNQSSYSSDKVPAPEATSALLQTISTVHFPVAAELEKLPVSVSDLMALAIGDVLKTCHRVENPVNIFVDNSVKFGGRLAAHDGRVVVQMTER